MAAGEHTAWLTRVDYPATSTLMLFSSSCGPEPVARVTEVDAFESPLAIDGTTLYWGTLGGAIYRQRLDADDHEVFARGFTSGSVSIVTDDEWVYWAQHGEGGVIRRAPK